MDSTSSSTTLQPTHTTSTHVACDPPPSSSSAAAATPHADEADAVTVPSMATIRAMHDTPPLRASEPPPHRQRARGHDVVMPSPARRATHASHATHAASSGLATVTHPCVSAQAPRLSASQEIGAAAAFFASPMAQSLSDMREGRDVTDVRLPAAMCCLPSPPMSSSAAAAAAAAVPAVGGDSLTGWPAAGSARYEPRLASPTTTTALPSAWSSSVVDPRDTSVFYPLGQAAQPPLLLHYIQLGHWRTIAAGRDYFSHRRLANREVIGHTVRWLHNARPAGRFVFLIEPVEERPADELDPLASNDDDNDEVGSGATPADARAGHAPPSSARAKPRRRRRPGLWARLRRALFGPAPAFAYNRGKLAKDATWLSAHVEDEGGDAGDEGDEAGEEVGGVEARPVAHEMLWASSPIASPLHSEPRWPRAAPLPTASPPLSYASGLLAASLTSSQGLVLSPASTALPLSLNASVTADGTTAASLTRSSPDRTQREGRRASPTTLGPLRRNKAIRRMLVAQLFGQEGPAVYGAQTADGGGGLDGDTGATPPLGPRARWQRSGRVSDGSLEVSGVLSASARSSSSSSRASSLGRASAASSACLTAPASAPERALFLSRPPSPLTIPQRSGTPKAGQGRRRRDTLPVDLVAASLLDDPIGQRRRGGQSLPGTRAQSQPPRRTAHARDGTRTRSPTRSVTATTVAAAAAPAPTTPAPPARPRRGVEVIEIAHTDVTALDYAPRLLSSRFSIEAKAAYTYFFPSTAAACCYYGCPEAVTQIQAQLRRGVSAHIPKTTERPDGRATVPGVSTLGSTLRLDMSAEEDVLAVATGRASGLAQSPTSSAVRMGEPLRDRSPYHDTGRLSADLRESHKSHDEPVAEEDEEALWSIARALKKGVMPPRMSVTHALPNHRSRSVSSSHASDSDGDGDGGVGRRHTRSQTALPAPSRATSSSCAPTRTAEIVSHGRPLFVPPVTTSRERERVQPRPPSLFADVPPPPVVSSAARESSAHDDVDDNDNDNDAEEVHGGAYAPHTPLRPRGPDETLARSPSVTPPPGATRTPLVLHRAATKAFFDASAVCVTEPVEASEAAITATTATLSEAASTPLTSGRAGARASWSRQHDESHGGECDRETATASAGCRGATDLAQSTRSTRTADPHAASFRRPVPPSPSACAVPSSSPFCAVDWRTLNVDAAPLPCVPPNEPIRPVLMSSHLDLIVSVYTADPHFNAALCELLMPESGSHPYTVSAREQQRLLSMYETGMPAWTIFVGSMSLIQYRRAYRVVYIGLINLWPLISLGVGVYDLYRHLPKMKRFMAHTIEPVVRRIEAHFTLRVSVWGTYLLSVLFTIFSSLSVFLSQFYVVQIASPVLKLGVMVLKLPCVVLLESVWSSLSIVASFAGLIWMTLKVLVLGPFLLVLHVTSLFGATSGGATTVIRGTSLTMRWWWAWQEFWITVASPIKNLVKAWWDSMLHLAISVSRREATLRRWYTARMAQLLGMTATCVERLLLVADSAADVVYVSVSSVWPEVCFLAQHAPAQVQWLWAWATAMALVHLLVTLAQERQQTSQTWRSAVESTARRNHPIAVNTTTTTTTTAMARTPAMCPAIPLTAPPLPLPMVLQWVWNSTLQLVQVCFVDLVRHSRPGWWQDMLCTATWLPDCVRYAAAPPCVVAEMAIMPDLPVSSAYDLDSARKALPPVAARAAEAVEAEMVPLYKLPFARYPSLPKTEDCAYIHDLLCLPVPGTTRIEYKMRFEEE